MVYFNTHWFFLKSEGRQLVSVAALGFFFVFSTVLHAQEITVEINSYKTALPDGSVGDWLEPGTWEIWDGSDWHPAISAPDRTNDVFIGRDKEVRLTQDQEVGNLYLFSSEGPGRKLNLQEFNLDVFGALRCFTDTTGIVELYPRTSLLTDWIYPETGNIVFKGSSRTVVDRASWSANNFRSRYGVIFNPEPGDTLIVNAAFKASRFTIQSGTVYQTVNIQGTPATSTFSFNTQDIFGSGAFGELVIEPGATLISEGSRDFGEIIRRSENVPAAGFHVKEGGSLVLYGQDPVIEAENILLEGDVYYQGQSGMQNFISSSMGFSYTYNNIFFEGAAVKKMPPYLDLAGNLTFMGGGDVLADSIQLDITGAGDQEIINLSLDVGILQITKFSGTVFFHGNLSVLKHFTMNQGTVDFMGNQLLVNVSGEGSYYYNGGSWKNLGELNYHHLPPVLNASNTTFPFEDQYLGGLRKMYLSGSTLPPNSSLKLVYTQLPEVNWDPGFNDHDGTPILYKVNSYFTLDLTSNTTLTDSINMFISADNLIILNGEDLRIVGDEAAAPGIHLGGGENFSAGRSVALSDLNSSRTYTLGSTGITSILPITWLSLRAEELLTGNLIRWSTAQEIENARFRILKFREDGEDLKEIGEVLARENANNIHYYSFLDKTVNDAGNIFYQIKYEHLDGDIDISPAFPLQRKDNSTGNQVKIFPNPHLDGQVTFFVPGDKTIRQAHIQVVDISGKKIRETKGRLEAAAAGIAHKLMGCAPGTYFIIIEADSDRQVLKWLKK